MASILTFTEAAIVGDHSGRLRLLVNELSSEDQRGLVAGVRCRHYSADDTALLVYGAEEMTPLDTAADATLAGAHDGSVVAHSNLSTNWTPVLSTATAGLVDLTHTGTYRLWVRFWSADGDAVKARFVYDVGDLVRPVENRAVQVPGASNFYLLPLGEIRLDPPSAGVHRWQGQIQAKGTVGGEEIQIDSLLFIPVDEGYVRLRAPIDPSQGLAEYVVRDEFSQSPGALTGKTAPIGGAWAAVANSDATDFQVVSGGGLERTAIGDSGTIATAPNLQGRMVYLPTSLTDDVVQVNLNSELQSSGFFQGIAARLVNATNFLLVVLNTALKGTQLFVVKYIGGIPELLTTGDLWTTGLPVNRQPTTLTTLRVFIDLDGRWRVWCYPQGGGTIEVANGQDDDLAAGGALAAGYSALYDNEPSAVANTRSYTGFSAFPLTPDAVVFADQSAELRWDGHVREDAAGVGYGQVSDPSGSDLVRIPASGLEDRPVEFIVVTSEGDLKAMPDSGIGALSGQVKYRPSYLFPPGS